MEALGCDEIDIADTIGTGTPKRVGDLFRAVGNVTDPAGILGHFHATYGQGLANTLAALEAGVTIFNNHVAGLGGCQDGQSVGQGKGETGSVDVCSDWSHRRQENKTVEDEAGRK